MPSYDAADERRRKISWEELTLDFKLEGFKLPRLVCFVDGFCEDEFRFYFGLNVNTSHFALRVLVFR